MVLESKRLLMWAVVVALEFKKLFAKKAHDSYLYYKVKSDRDSMFGTWSNDVIFLIICEISGGY